jgi:hypothetical protein
MGNLKTKDEDALIEIFKVISWLDDKRWEPEKPEIRRPDTLQPELLLPWHQFEAKVRALTDRIKASKPAPGFEAMRLPGERGQQSRERLLQAGVLEVDAATAAYLRGEK